MPKCMQQVDIIAQNTHTTNQLNTALTHIYNFCQKWQIDLCFYRFDNRLSVSSFNPKKRKIMMNLNHNDRNHFVANILERVTRLVQIANIAPVTTTDDGRLVVTELLPVVALLDRITPQISQFRERAND